MDKVITGIIVAAYGLFMIAICFYIADKINNSAIWKKYWE